MRRQGLKRISSSSTVSGRQNAELVIIKDLQKQAHTEEMKTLKDGNLLQRNNKLHHLHLFLDKDAVLKVGGRLRCSSLPRSVKQPTVILRQHHVTKLTITHCHEKVQHQGKGFNINETRASGYWIPGLSHAVASHIGQCVTCQRRRGQAVGQKMSDVPTERMESSPPFTYCGMDCFGPLLTKQGGKEQKKRWLALYMLQLSCNTC